MKKLFWGFFLIYLNFTLGFNQHTLNVLPDFAGYLLLIKGMDELEHESGLFQGARPFAIGMAVYTAVLWVGDLLGVDGDGWLTQLLGLVAMVAALYISWVLIQGVQDMEQRREVELNSGALHLWWKGLLMVQLAAKLLGLMANLTNLGVIATLSVLLGAVGLVCIVLFLNAWYRCSAAYEMLSCQDTPVEE